MKSRVLIGVVLVAMLVGVLCLDGWLRAHQITYPFASALILLGLTTRAALELFRMIEAKVPELGVPGATAIAGGLVALRLADSAIAGHHLPPALLFLIVLLLVFGPELLWPRLASAGPRLAGRLLGITFILPLTCLIDVGIHLGPVVLGWLVLAIKGSDIGGFFAGKLIGGVRLAPLVSPNKTIAGLLGGLVLVSTITLLGRSLLEPVPPPGVALLFGACLAVAGTIGDLSESVIKRSFGVKDSAVLIGEAGGVLDLVDSLVLSAPVGYLFLVHVFPKM